MKIRLKPISEQVVALVGATSGIGLETAMYMAGKGARVAIVGRSQEGLNDALNQIRTHAENTRALRMRGTNGSSRQSTDYAAQGGLESAETGGAPVTTMDEQVIALEGDVTNFDQMKSVAEQIIARMGRIDTWVNVAAVSEWALFEDTSPDEFRRIIEVNLLGQAFGAMAVLPYLKQQQGSALIFVASIAGRLPIPYQSAYNASKHGILGLADTLRQEFKHTGVPVSVTAILPASIDTPLFEKARTKLGVEPEPIKPVYDVRLVARAITHAAQHPVNELIVGDAGYMMTFMRRLAPTLTGNLMGTTGFRQQRSNEAKSAQAPDNLFHHISGYDETQGETVREAMGVSPLTWLSTHPRARMALYGGLIGGLGALVGWRIVLMRRERMSWRYRLPREAKKLSRQVSKLAKKTSKQASKTANKTLRNAGSTVVTLPVISQMPMFRKRSFLEKAADMALGWWAAITAIQMPFRRKKTVMQRVSGAISDRMPDISMPNISLRRQGSMVDRITMAEQRKAVAKMATKQGVRAAKLVKKQTDRAVNLVSKQADQVSNTASDIIDDSRKQAAKQSAKAVAALDKQSKRAAKQSAKAAAIVDKQSKRAAKKVERAANRMDDMRKDALKTASKAMPSKRDIKDMVESSTTPVVVRKQSFVERLPFGYRRETIVEKLPVNKK